MSANATTPASDEILPIFRLLEELERVARLMPRCTPAGGGASTRHSFEISAGVVWGNDMALRKLDAHRRLGDSSRWHEIQSDATYPPPVEALSRAHVSDHLGVICIVCGRPGACTMSTTVGGGQGVMRELRFLPRCNCPSPRMAVSWVEPYRGG